MVRRHTNLLHDGSVEYYTHGLDDIAKDLQEQETLAEIADSSFKSSSPTPDSAAPSKVTFSSELDTDDPYSEYFNSAKTQSDMKLLLSTTLNSVGIDVSDHLACVSTYR